MSVERCEARSANVSLLRDIDDLQPQWTWGTSEGWMITGQQLTWYGYLQVRLLWSVAVRCLWIHKREIAVLVGYWRLIERFSFCAYYCRPLCGPGRAVGFLSIWMISFERNDLWRPRCSARWFILTLSRSLSTMKCIGQSWTSQGTFIEGNVFG